MEEEKQENVVGYGRVSWLISVPLSGSSVIVHFRASKHSASRDPEKIVTQENHQGICLPVRLSLKWAHLPQSAE